MINELKPISTDELRLKLKQVYSILDNPTSSTSDCKKASIVIRRIEQELQERRPKSTRLGDFFWD